MVVSWLAIILGVLTAIAIAFHEVAHPQHMKIMNVVWPVTGLYVPVIGWWAYTGLGRPKLALAHSTPAKNEFWRSVFVSSTHCASTHFYRSVIRASNEFESQMSHLFASLPARIGDSGY
jgi:hypothetical protein